MSLLTARILLVDDQEMMREAADAGGTVFLSSHTLSEVERVADRVGIIRHGRLVAVESVATLRERAIRTIELTFDGPVDGTRFELLDGAREVTVDDRRVTVSFDGEMHELLQVATDVGALQDITTHEADLEEIFLTYYRDEEVVA